jgi:hypothetical protein
VPYVRCRGAQPLQAAPQGIPSLPCNGIARRSGTGARLTAARRRGTVVSPSRVRARQDGERGRCARSRSPASRWSAPTTLTTRRPRGATLHAAPHTRSGSAAAAAVLARSERRLVPSRVLCLLQRRPSSGSGRELEREELWRLVTIRLPPPLHPPHVPLGGLGNANLHGSARSSFASSSASACSPRRAAARPSSIARSTCFRCSGGMPSSASGGWRSTSSVVPSGRSTGSSSMTRPFRTWARRAAMARI